MDTIYIQTCIRYAWTLLIFCTNNKQILLYFSWEKAKPSL